MSLKVMSSPSIGAFKLRLDETLPGLLGGSWSLQQEEGTGWGPFPLRSPGLLGWRVHGILNKHMYRANLPGGSRRLSVKAAVALKCGMLGFQAQGWDENPLCSLDAGIEVWGAKTWGSHDLMGKHSGSVQPEEMRTSSDIGEGRRVAPGWQPHTRRRPLGIVSACGEWIQRWHWLGSRRSQSLHQGTALWASPLGTVQWGGRPPGWHRSQAWWSYCEWKLCLLSDF